MKLLPGRDEVTRYKPMVGHALVRMWEDARHKGVIQYADNARPWQPFGEVVTLGDQRRTKQGHPIPAEFGLGDTIFFQPAYGTLFETHEGDRYVLIDQSHVLAVME